jgi:hypothetical protein
MHFSTVTMLLAFLSTSVLADSKLGNGHTVESALNTCGSAQFNCCNRIEQAEDETNAGLLANVLGGNGGVGIDCKWPVPVMVLYHFTDLFYLSSQKRNSFCQNAIINSCEGNPV